MVRIEPTRDWTRGGARVPLVLLVVLSAVLLTAVAGAAAGDLDTSFGTGAKVTTDFNGRSNDGGVGVALQRNGKIVVAGASTGGGSRDFALAAYLGR